MSGLTILEMAANVRQKKAELDEVSAQLRQAKLDGWTNFGLAADEAMQIASDGLRHAWTALDRLNWIAKDALKTVPPNVGGNPRERSAAK